MSAEAQLRYLRGIFSIMVAIVLALVVSAVLLVSVDVRRYIDLQSVSVTHAPSSATPWVDVLRFIHRDFSGGYSVEIREFPSWRSVCSTGNINRPYSRQATLGMPSENDALEGGGDAGGRESLSWWAYGGDCTGKLGDGLPDGRYIMRSCHYVRLLPWVPIYSRPRCVMSNDFVVGSPPFGVGGGA